VQLGELQIYNNALTTLPASVGKLARLTELDLQYCRITSLPDEIGDLPALTEISLRDNHLTALPAAIARCPALASIDLSDNPDLDLAGAFRILAQVPSLRRLSLFSNKLTRLPDEIGLLTQLEDLWLACARPSKKTSWRLTTARGSGWYLPGWSFIARAIIGRTPIPRSNTPGRP